MKSVGTAAIFFDASLLSNFRFKQARGKGWWLEIETANQT